MRTQLRLAAGGLLGGAACLGILFGGRIGSRAAGVQDSDSRLDQKVSLQSTDSRLTDVIADLARRSGVAMAVSPGVRERRVTAFVDGATVGDVQHSLADLYGLSWQAVTAQGHLAVGMAKMRGSVAGATQYRLVEAPTAAASERSAAAGEFGAFASRLKVWKQWASAGAAGEAAFRASHQGFFSRPAWWVGTDGSPGSGQAVAGAFFSLSATDQQAVIDGRPVRLPWSAIADRYRTQLEAAISHAMATQGPRHVERARDSHGNLRVVLDSTTQIPAGAFREAQTAFWSSPDEPADQRAIYVRTYNLSVLTPVGFGGQHELVEEPWTLAFGGQVPLRGYQGTFDDLTRRVAAYVQPLARTDPTAADKLDREALLPKSDGWTSLPVILDALHRQTGMNILADYHYDSGVVPTQRAPAATLLELVADSSNRTWRLDHGIALMRADGGELSDLRDRGMDAGSDLMQPGAWRDQIAGWGTIAQAPYWAWKDLAGAAGAQVSAPWNSSWTVARSGTIYNWGIHNVDPDSYYLLQFYGRLTAAQQKEMQTQAGVALAGLTAAQEAPLLELPATDFGPYLKSGHVTLSLVPHKVGNPHTDVVPENWWLARFQVAAPGAASWSAMAGAPDVTE